MRLRFCSGKSIFAFILLGASGSVLVRAQADYPFRDPKLPDGERIADLLERLTLAEKVTLMSNAPKFERLKLSFSGQVEGLHGLALGGPGGWGPRGRQPLPTTTFPQEKGLGNTWDPELMTKIGALEGQEARYYYQNPVFSFGDSKSVGGNSMGVQLPLPAPSRFHLSHVL